MQFHHSWKEFRGYCCVFVGTGFIKIVRHFFKVCFTLCKKRYQVWNCERAVG